MYRFIGADLIIILAAYLEVLFLRKTESAQMRAISHAK